MLITVLDFRKQRRRGGCGEQVQGSAERNQGEGDQVEAGHGHGSLLDSQRCRQSTGWSNALESSFFSKSQPGQLKESWYLSNLLLEAQDHE